MDPRKLSLEPRANFGLPQETLLRDDADPDAAAASIVEYQSWAAARSAARTAGETPEYVIVTPSDGEPLPDGFEAPVETVQIAGGRAGGAAGKRFGTLVHTVLSTIAYDADERVIRDRAELTGRVLGASSVEVDAAVDVVGRALQHPLLQRAHTAEVCRRESPLALDLGDGKVFEGTIDMTFRDPGEGWTVVDFKTDVAPSSTKRAEDERQVAWYVYALAKLTDEAVRGVVLRL